MTSELNSRGTGQPKPKHSFPWVWIVIGLVILAVVAGILINNARQQREAERITAISQTATAVAQAASTAGTGVDTSEPFGKISFGWGGFRPLTCVVSQETTTFSAEDLKTAKFIYFVSPFSPTEVGNFIKWKIVRPDGTTAYDAESKIWPDSDLCFWQGFVLADEEPGTYTLEITDWKGGVTVINFSNK